MEAGVVVAIVSGSVAISIPALTYWFTKRREDVMDEDLISVRPLTRGAA